jgi:hypothetical protein
MIKLQELIAEAEQLCDSSGFDAFRKKFFPNLGKSRVYELLAIASGKKSIEETRAVNRKRVAKYRANKAPASLSVTVTEKLERDALGAANEVEVLDEGATLVPVQVPQLARPQSRIATGDSVLLDFSSRVLELIRRTSNKKVERFAKTSVTADELAQLGKFLIAIADLKRSATPDRASSRTVFDSVVSSVQGDAGGPL